MLCGIQTVSAHRRAASKAARKRDTVYLFAFPRPKGSLAMSCLKVETFLRLCKIPHEVVFLMTLGQSPTGRLPYIEYNGEELAESEFIIKRLAEIFPSHCGADATALTSQELATKTALRRIIETHMYFGKGRNSYVDHYVKLAKVSQTNLNIPGFLALWIVKYSLRQKCITLLNLQGYGDLTDAQYHEEFLTDIQAVEVTLAEEPFAARDVPSVQAMLYGYLAPLRADCAAGMADGCPALQHFAKSAVLNGVVDSIEARAFPDKAELLRQ